MSGLKREEEKIIRKRRQQQTAQELKTWSPRTVWVTLSTFYIHLMSLGRGTVFLFTFPTEPPAYNKWRAFSEACFFNFYSGHSRTDWPSGVADLWACVTSAALIGRKKPAHSVWLSWFSLAQSVHRGACAQQSSIYTISGVTSLFPVNFIWGHCVHHTDR